MSTLTCITCIASFDTQEERDKYPLYIITSDWHSYNVKRKIAGLGPYSRELFDERQRLLQSSKVEEKKQIKLYCDICSKSFSSKNAFDQHENSKRHLQGLKQAEIDFQNAPEEALIKKVEETDVAEVVAAENGNIVENKIPGQLFTPEPYEFRPFRCLFCRLDVDSLDSNLAHMKKNHGFIIPDFESVTDLEGLIDYLGQKISIGCLCISCNHGFKSPMAVRAHMDDCAHSRMSYITDEDFEEFEDFYDYSLANENPLVAINVTATGELQLPDGRLLGNREFSRYYKQNYSNENEKREAIISKMLTNSTGSNKQTNALMLYEAKKKELVVKRDDVERFSNYTIRERLRAGMNMNKIHLAHFSHR